MSTSGNLPNISQNQTTQYFNNFFTQTRGVSPGMNDTVIAYFQSVTGDVETGKNLASAVIATAVQQGMDPVDVVDQLKKLSDKLKLDSPQYAQRTNQNAQDNNEYDNGVWSSGGKQYAKPGPSTAYLGISELNAYLTMFLNLNRIPTSLLGLSNSPQTSKYISRSILA